MRQRRSWNGHCEICEAATDGPVNMTFSQKKIVSWLICEGCTLVLINYIKRMAKKADAIPQT